jgi:hypothetical protein
MKKIFTLILILIILAAIISCRQSPLFFIISTETAPKPALIPGSPTKMVVFNRNNTETIFVASGRIHWYAKQDENGKPVWNFTGHIPQPPPPHDRVIDLAATVEYLYALCMSGNGVDIKLKRIKQNASGWEDIAENINFTLTQSIYADETGILFAGARKDDNDGSNYAILYMDENKGSNLTFLRGVTGMLSGMARDGNNYYLCTTGDGIFSVNFLEDSPSHQILADTSEEDDRKDDIVFMGMVKRENEIIAIKRYGGYLYNINTIDNTYKRIKISNNNTDAATGRYATGALAIWEDPGNKILTAGVQNSISGSSTSYNNGYVEFPLSETGSLVDMYDPPRETVRAFSDQYRASLGKHPVNHLFQVPEYIDEEMTFFASTQNAGLWSFRYYEDSGGWKWNAETEETDS